MSAPAERLLAGAGVDAAVAQRHPDYVAVLVTAEGLQPGPGTAHSESLLQAAESAAAQRLAGRHPHELPEVEAWRAAYRSFGVRPREARSSIEALLRRCAAGLPRIDRLTDVYNAVSVLHAVPVGGEDLAGYDGPPRLVVADGSEPFDTVADGRAIVQTAAAGEIVWRDDAGVTCRRWNWRQCVRTRLTERTTRALFIVDGLGPDAGTRASAAADDLVEELAVDSPTAVFDSRVLGTPADPQPGSA